MESRSASASTDEIVADLNVINKYFPNNLGQAIKELSFPGAPTTEDEMIGYANELMTYACQRLLMDTKEFFPYSSNGEIRGKICPLLKEIFEKNPDKLILTKKSSEERGVIGVHPFLSVFYEELEGDFEGNIKANYDSRSVTFEKVTWDASELAPEPYISLHPDDFYDLTGRLASEGEKVRMDYDIVFGHNHNFLTIDMFKPYSRLKPRVEMSSVVAQASQEREVKLVAKPRPSTPKEHAEAILLMLDRVTCDIVKTELKLLYTTLTINRGNLVDGDKILDAYAAIKDLVPEKTFKDPDTLIYRNKITAALNEIIIKEKHAESEKTE